MTPPRPSVDFAVETLPSTPSCATEGSRSQPKGKGAAFSYRIAIIGNSGAGKSTLARALSKRLGIPHVELDALNWRPGWVGLHQSDPELWSRNVAEAVSGDA